jgi:hypothetical protein
MRRNKSPRLNAPLALPGIGVTVWITFENGVVHALKPSPGYLASRLWVATATSRQQNQHGKKCERESHGAERGPTVITGQSHLYKDKY